MTTLLVDAAGLWFRAFYALPETITGPDGQPVNAVRGFCEMLAALLERDSVTDVVVCLDLDWRPQFRVDLLPQYKAHRLAEGGGPAESGAPPGEAEPESLGPQVRKILALLRIAGVKTAGAVGFEADDVIATLVERERKNSLVIATGDRDLLQLVSDQPVPVRVRYLGRGVAKSVLYGPLEVAQQYGVPHDRAGRAYAELAVLRGDPSDGLPGVAGIGEKTAARLLNTYGSLSEIVRCAHEGKVTPPRIQSALVNADDYVRRALDVVLTRRDAAIVPHPSWGHNDRQIADSAAPASADREQFQSLAEEYGVSSAANKLFQALTGLS